MTHLGDITKISGYDAPAVDCIIGGSPCQDLSVAGKRAGLAGARSSLFMEQIRIVKEMRENECRHGRTARPRFMVWENVPGALSSNKGEDFRVVLEEIARVADENAAVSQPPKGKWTASGCIMGDGYSIAWRILDAQFWGVPQRRRRIALVADFGGHAAPEILFVRKGVCGDTAESGGAGQGVAGGAEIGFGETGVGYWQSGIQCLRAEGENRPSRPSNVVLDGVNPAVAKCLKAKANLSFRDDSDTLICTPEIMQTLDTMTDKQKFCIAFSGGQGAKAGGLGIAEECAPSLKAVDSGSNRTPCICIAGDTIDRHAACLYPDVTGTICASGAGTNRQAGQGNEGDFCIVQAVDCRNLRVTHESGTLQAKANGGQSLNYINPVLTYQDTTGTLTSGAHAGSYNGQDAYNDMLPCDGRIVRRLTPLECERLQGYPDGWTDIGAWTDSKGKPHKESSDSARYKALGNSIALPPWKWVLKRLCACYERDATMASLFDGIGGFPLIWEQLNGRGSCLWASEIAEFPLAVTRVRFGA